MIYHVSLAGARALGNAVQMSDDQTMFAQEVGKKYELNRGEVTMGTPEHKEHRASLKKQLNDLRQEIKESQEWVAENVKELISTRFDLDSVTEELERTQQALDRKTQELEELEEDIEAARDELEWASEAWKTAKADIRYAAHARGDADEYVEESKEYSQRGI